jgi:hypothetical protein
MARCCGLDVHKDSVLLVFWTNRAKKCRKALGGFLEERCGLIY